MGKCMGAACPWRCFCSMAHVEETVHTTSTPSTRYLEEGSAPPTLRNEPQEIGHASRTGGLPWLGGLALSKANTILETFLLQTTINIRTNEDTGACASAQPEKAIATSE